MQKMVDGKIVEMTPAEVAQRKAEDAAHAASLLLPPPPPPLTVEALYAALKAKGIVSDADVAR